ncbi:MAG: hypothetical protein MJE77_45320 [Proteobacteria bacterium]|nr:hypothetical protein [Pseudomonadota bacterium]
MKHRRVCARSLPGRYSALLAALLASFFLAESSARAECPTSGSPSRAVCKYSNSIFMPSAAGRIYLPGDDAGMGPWYGGGVQLILFTWSDNSDRFGPGQGKFFFDMGILSSGEDGSGQMVMYRGGANLSLERNASRNWLIPFFGFSIGGLHEKNLKRHGFVEGLLGVYVFYTANMILGIEGGYLFPFSDADSLAGFASQATLSVSLW